MFEHASRIAGATTRARSMRRRMTWSEQRLWKELRKLDATFRRQAPIGPYFADFAAYAPKLVVEVDGGIHERLEAVQLRDVERQRWLEKEGFRVLRFTDREVSGDIHACIDKIKALLLEGGGLGGGVAAELKGGRGLASAPKDALNTTVLRTPPSPALPPSRRKGERLPRAAEAD
jgi:very-short-patch-repair endonuclease